MRLIVENFRCYRGTCSFDFTNDGITLISGHSGAGKTSVLMALYFAITGNCPPKVVSDGCDSCKVTLELNDFTIIRTRRPNRVVIPGLNLEDDLAQQYIHRHFGKYFDITSYIQQQYQKTFLYQSPAEKLEILEKLCFDESSIQPEELKKNCMIYFKQFQTEHIALKSRHATLTEQYAEYQDITPPEPIASPDHGDLQQLMSQLERIKLSEQEYYDQLSNQSKRDEYTRSIEELTQQYHSCVKSPFTEQQLNDQLFRLKELDRLVIKPVWQTHSKEDCKQMITDYKQDIEYHREYTSLCEKIQKLTAIEQQIHDLEHKKKAIECLSEGIYQCPSCKVSLSLNNKRLEQTTLLTSELSTDEKNRKLEVLDAQIVQLQSKIRSLEHYRTRQTELTGLIDIGESLTQLEEDYQWIVDYYESNRSTDMQNNISNERRQQLADQLINELDIEHCDKWIKHIQTQTQLDDKICYIQRQLDAIPHSKYESSIEQLSNTRQQIESDIQSYHQQNHAYELYKLQYSRYEKSVSLATEISNLTDQLTRIERKMRAVSELRQLILKTESEIIDQKTREISELVNIYCAQIFNEPITIELKTTKKTSTQSDKVQIQLEVYYKNMKCDASLLSGGEQARLNLAFVLAFAHVFHAKLLLLDECTSNLDQELVRTVTEQIEQVGIPKVIVIAHQIVEGNFKQILHIPNLVKN